MQYQGPEAADLANVQALNLAFLETQCHARDGADASSRPDVLQGLQALPQQHRRRIADSPFLLFSLADADERRWQRLIRGAREPDLIDAIEPNPTELTSIAAATLGFLWQLSKKNPYAARVVSGASLGCCERLANSMLVDLFRAILHEPEPVTLRLQNNRAFWLKLMRAGTSDERSVRRAAQLSALQTVLTFQAPEIPHRLPAAACKMPVPALRVADHDG